MSNCFIFLDRDGVLNRDRSHSVRHRSEFELIDRVPAAIHRLNEKGYRLIVITNQACIGRGDLDIAELKAIHDQMKMAIEAGGGGVTDIYVCPHTDADGCTCRKPEPGLLIQASKDYGIDLRTTWFIGDDERDMQAAAAAGCRPGIVRTGKGSQWTPPDEVAVFDDLYDFASCIHSVVHD